MDVDKDGNIDKGELKAALIRAGIAVNPNRLEEFFESMDKNNDGVISFEEWRYDRWHPQTFARGRGTPMCTLGLAPKVVADISKEIS